MFRARERLKLYAVEARQSAVGRKPEEPVASLMDGVDGALWQPVVNRPLLQRPSTRDADALRAQGAAHEDDGEQRGAREAEHCAWKVRDAVAGGYARRSYRGSPHTPIGTRPDLRNAR